MGLIFKARGRASFVLFLIRFTLGSLFLISGANKIVDIEGFINNVKGLNVMPENLAFIFGFILPFAEVLFGALYIIGLFTPITSFFLSVMIVGIITTLGPGDDTLPFTYNFVFLACAIGTMFSGAGIISFDALLDRKKHDEGGQVITRRVVSNENSNTVHVVKKDVVHKDIPHEEVKNEETVIKEVKVEPEDVKDVKPDEELNK